ncbi:hypothetical protein [Burkholderia oklahomensis]|uniref:hypothetical protein n=1 Tax=Burkholderia oklahomensis TaxID=342113 RepID=UPI00130DBE5A|nr:hypothetical protein [Burkholderia oklahomensis]QPS37104.1 hypothetical protein I6G57_17850 [Burkholderia oklahomensis]
MQLRLPRAAFRIGDAGGFPRAPIDERPHKRREQTCRRERTGETTIRLKARASSARCGAIGFASGGGMATPRKTRRPLNLAKTPDARRRPTNSHSRRSIVQDSASLCVPCDSRSRTISTRRIRRRRVPFAEAAHDEAIRLPFMLAQMADDGVCAAS